MMGLVSCYSELAIQVSETTSCSNYKHVSNSVAPNLVPSSTQTAVTNLYKTTLCSGAEHVISVTWVRSTATQGLQINSGDDPTTAFRLNTNSRLFRKKRGNKGFEINGTKYEVFYDLSGAIYDSGAEPVEGYYVLIMVDTELGLYLGDLSAVKKVKPGSHLANFSLISRKEHFSGNTLYATKAQFSDVGTFHDVLIQCKGESDRSKSPSLSVCIDKRVVIQVKRLQWNFRGNQTIFVDGLSVDLMWDVHDWFFSPGSGSGHGTGSGYGSGQAVFLFRTRNGLDSRLWLEEKVKKKGDKKEFSLLIYANKS